MNLTTLPHTSSITHIYMHEFVFENIPKCQWINPSTPGAFCQKCGFFDILVIFRLGFGQISFNLVEKAFATQQFTLHAASVTSIVFYDILARACAEVFGRESDLSIFEFFFRCSFFSFSFLFASVIGLQLKKTSQKASLRRANLTMV